VQEIDLLHLLLPPPPQPLPPLQQPQLLPPIPARGTALPSRRDHQGDPGVDPTLEPTRVRIVTPGNDEMARSSTNISWMLTRGSRERVGPAGQAGEEISEWTESRRVGEAYRIIVSVSVDVRAAQQSNWVFAYESL